LAQHPQLKGFVLIGGTALTLHIGHRVSEDLDFACTEPHKHLPKAQIKALVRDLGQRGVRLVLHQDPLAEEEFAEAGLELDNYQQNFIASVGANSAVKVSLVCYDAPMDELLPGKRRDPLRVASLREIFATKAWVCSERSKTRDWIDLYVLLTQHGFSFDDVYAVFNTIHRLPAFASLCMRLRACRVNAADEGYESLMDKAPSVDELREFFNKEIDALERRLAAVAFRATRH
jgi:predicted nucleotidyltransferase component of viral defense system